MDFQTFILFRISFQGDQKDIQYVQKYPWMSSHFGYLRYPDLSVWSKFLHEFSAHVLLADKFFESSISNAVPLSQDITVSIHLSCKYEFAR
jgi:hypothetical protein